MEETTHDREARYPAYVLRDPATVAAAGASPGKWARAVAAVARNPGAALATMVVLAVAALAALAWRWFGARASQNPQNPRRGGLREGLSPQPPQADDGAAETMRLIAEINSAAAGASAAAGP